MARAVKSPQLQGNLTEKAFSQPCSSCHSEAMLPRVATQVRCTTSEEARTSRRFRRRARGSRRGENSENADVAGRFWERRTGEEDAASGEEYAARQFFTAFWTSSLIRFGISARVMQESWRDVAGVVRPSGALYAHSERVRCKLDSAANSLQAPCTTSTSTGAKASAPRDHTGAGWTPASTARKSALFAATGRAFSCWKSCFLARATLAADSDVAGISFRAPLSFGIAECRIVA